MAVKAKHSAGGEYSPDWRPKVNHPSIYTPDSLSRMAPLTTHSPPSTSPKNSCRHLPAHLRAHPQALQAACPKTTWDQKRPLVQAGASFTNVRSPARAGERAKPQPQPQHLSRPRLLHPLPSRRPAPIFPRGRSGGQIPTCTPSSAVRRPRRQSCRHPLVRVSLVSSFFSSSLVPSC